MRTEYRATELYAIEGAQLRRLADVALRLFTEQRMNGDQMRDAAQVIEAALDQAIEIPDGYSQGWRS